MNIFKSLQEGVKNRFPEKGKAKFSQKKEQLKAAKSKVRELYTDNEDLGFC